MIDAAQRAIDAPFRHLRGLGDDISDYVLEDANGVRVDWGKANRKFLGNRQRRLELLHAAITKAPDVVAERGWDGVDKFMIGLLVSNMSISAEVAVEELINAHEGE
mgnify:FL=1